MENKEYSCEELIKQINELTAELSSIKKYGLVWDKESVAEEIVEKCKSNIPILNLISDKSIVCGKNNNVLIEGDNYHSLLTLNYCEKDSFDMIYIDPPYNTGNEDFVFNDKYLNPSDEYKHSKWLNFMDKRLKLARNLLKDDGYIFISIDDNEFAQLKLLCDQIFGQKEYVATFLWKKTDTPPSLSNKVRRKYEYILCYGRNVDPGHRFSQGPIEGDSAPLLNSGNPYKAITFPKQSVHFNIPDGVYKANGNYKIELVNDVIVKNGLNEEPFTAKGSWKWAQNNLDEEVKKGTYFIVKSNKFSIRYQRTEVKTVKVPQNNLNSELKVGTNEEASKELVDIFNKTGVFDYPKPVSLIKFLIKMINKGKNIRILDFFAGSGTTGQAVLELNSEDGGKRSFVLCTDNSKSIDATGEYLHSLNMIDEKPKKTDKTKYSKWKKEVKRIFDSEENKKLWNLEYEKYGIAQRITYPRLKTVLTGIREDGTVYGKKFEENLYYFKTDFVKDCSNSDSAKYELAEKIDALLCIKEDIYNLVESGASFSHYSKETSHLFIYNDIYNVDKFSAFKEKVLAANGIKIVYLFSFDNNLDESYFDDKSVIVKPIPAKIYEIYKEIAECIKRGE